MRELVNAGKLIKGQVPRPYLRHDKPEDVQWLANQMEKVCDHAIEYMHPADAHAYCNHYKLAHEALLQDDDIPYKNDVIVTSLEAE